MSAVPSVSGNRHVQVLQVRPNLKNVCGVFLILNVRKVILNS